MTKLTRVQDFDGIPHDADTGAPISNAQPEPASHWIDDLPASPLDGIVLVTKPSDQVFAFGTWMRRDEYELRKAIRDMDATAAKHVESLSRPIAEHDRINGTGDYDETTQEHAA